MGELRSWEDVRTLRVQVDRLRRWFRPGLLCIGDAAHAMSPIGGVGINLAVHDAVAAANLLVRPLRDGTLSTRHLARVQLRRLLPTVVVQWGQRTIQDRFLSPLLAGRVPAKGPLVLRALRRYPVLQGIPARLVGLGVLPEHVRTPAAAARPRPHRPASPVGKPRTVESASHEPLSRWWRRVGPTELRVLCSRTPYFAPFPDGAPVSSRMS